MTANTDVATTAADFIKTHGPVYVKKFGVSGLMGTAVSVVACRLASKFFYAVGISLAAIQYGVYLGLLTVHWGRVQQVTSRVDRRQMTKENATRLYHRVLYYLDQVVPDLSGFAAGLALGYLVLA